MKIELIGEIKELAQDHPAKKHDEDHVDLWKEMELASRALEEVELKLRSLDARDRNTHELLSLLKKRIDDLFEICEKMDDKYGDLYKAMADITARHPKIITMKKTALLTDGINVVDTVDLESGRYLMVKYITPKDSNEYADLDDRFGWAVVEVTDGKYDVKVQLYTTTEGELATMTADIDLIFIKY